MPDVRITRADNSNNDGGFNDISCTKRTINGFSRKESCKKRKNMKRFDYYLHKFYKIGLFTSTRFFNVIISRGKCRNRFLCNESVFKFVKRAMLAGNTSIKLSLNDNA